jgi:hypothetical protein
MTVKERLVLQRFYDRLHTGPAEGDVESERDAGFEAGEQCAYDNLKDEFGTLLDSLGVPRSTKQPTKRRPR